MRRSNRGAAAADLITAGAIAAAAVALLLWLRMPPASRRADRRANAAARALNLSLDRHAAARKGVYPPTSDVNGSPRHDALIHGGFIKKIPENPYRPGRAMRNIGKETFSPGDFYYARALRKDYEYTLIVYAGTPRGGPQRNGVIFEHRPRE